MAYLPSSSPATFSPMAIHEGQNSTQGPPEKNNELIHTVLPIYILLITVLGIVFNVFVLMVFCFHKKACTVAEIYLGNLAAADLVLVSCLPFWAVNVIRRYNWPFNRAMCKLTNLGIVMNSYCSIYFLVLVSIDRFMALVHPLSHETMRRPKSAKLSCLLVWTLGLILSVPTLMYREVYHDSTTNTAVCYMNYTDGTVMLTCEGTVTMFAFIIPICIVSFCTFKIIRALNNRTIEGLNGQIREHKATTLVLAVLLAFLICWVPFHVTKVIELLARMEVSPNWSLIKIIDTFKQIFIYLAFFNSVLNPILYVIVGKNFRKKVKELFMQWTHERTSTLSRMSTQTSVSRSVKSARL